MKKPIKNNTGVKRTGIKRRFLKLIIALALILMLPGLVTLAMAIPRWQTVESASPQPAAIVFGAGLYPDGSPMPALEDRILYAANLYKAGKAQMILMSGDRRSDVYDEPAAMQAYAVKLGVPEKAIVKDDAGFRTYDTCYRAKNVFEVDDAILVTTDYHLPRALYLCNSLGVNSDGVASGWGSSPRGPVYFMGIFREFPATITAMMEVISGKPIGSN